MPVKILRDLEHALSPVRAYRLFRNALSQGPSYSGRSPLDIHHLPYILLRSCVPACRHKGLGGGYVERPCEQRLVRYISCTPGRHAVLLSQLPRGNINVHKHLCGKSYTCPLQCGCNQSDGSKCSNLASFEEKRSHQMSIICLCGNSFSISVQRRQRGGIVRSLAGQIKHKRNAGT